MFKKWTSLHLVQKSERNSNANVVKFMEAFQLCICISKGRTTRKFQPNLGINNA
jgi:hypothetical protein